MQANHEPQASDPNQKGKTKRHMAYWLKTYPKAVRYLNTESPDPDITAIIEDVRKMGVQEESIVLLKRFLAVLHKARNNWDATIQLNRYILGGISALNLLLFSVLATAGRTDNALSIAWLAWAVSIVCTAGGLFLSSKQGKIKNLAFPLFYSLFLNLSFFGCGVAMTAFIWHFWNVAGWLFAILAVIIYGLCMFYEAITRIREANQEQQKP